MNIDSNLKSPMSIKSCVISTPIPAESMKEIMKKIREDLKDKEQTNKAEVPTLVMKNNVLDPSKKLKLSHVNQAPKVIQVNSDVIETPKEGKLSKVKPLRDSLVDFMKKVELMKESERNLMI